MPRVTITIADRPPQPYRFPLDSGSVTIGRGSENDIAVDCGSVSVKHAEMARVPGGFELRDLGSTNGMKEGGEPRSVVSLRDGSSVQIGDVAFDITFSPEEIELLARETPLDPGPPRLPEMKKEEATVFPAEDVPVSAPAPRQAAPVLVSSGGGWGCGAVLLFLILAAAAFFAGMAIRFQKETGGNLIEAIQKKQEAPAAPEEK